MHEKAMIYIFGLTVYDSNLEANDILYNITKVNYLVHRKELI